MRMTDNESTIRSADAIALMIACMILGMCLGYMAGIGGP